MANMVGVWKLVPGLTTGHAEFAKAMGEPDEEIKKDLPVYTFHLSRDGDVWAMKIDVENVGTWIDLMFKMGEPFTYMSGDKVTKLTSLITLSKDDHFIEKMTSEKDGVIKHWNVDTYRDGDSVITIQTKDGKSETQHLRKYMGNTK